MIGKNVILVEDILDTGLTLTYLEEAADGAPAEIFPHRRFAGQAIAQKTADPRGLCGFQHSDEFVVGYGLDYAEKYRNLPDICVVPREG